MSKVNVTLDNVQNVINALEELQRDYEKLPKLIAKDLADIGKDYLNEQYASSPNRLDANIDFSSITISTEEHDKGYKLIATSPDILYEEFGTGDRGEQSPHPEKSKYPLNPYNSGPMIRDVNDVIKGSYTDEDLKAIGITSGKFWYYEKDGMGHYTQGIPAGKEMFNTRNYLMKNRDKITRKRVDEVNGKFINAVKN